MNFDKKF